MPTISWTQRRENGVTLVEAVVQSTTPTGPTTVALESRLSGPVWPPRSEGIPVAGWDGARYETTVEGESRVAVGFASPAEPSEPPVELVESAPATTIDDEESADTDAADVLRALGDPTPPRGAVPTSLPEESLPTARGDAKHTDDDQ